MSRTILTRLLQAVPVALGVSFITFILLNLLPGDTAEIIVGPGSTRQELNLVRSELGLNQPLIDRYLHWLGAALTGNLGRSIISGQSVTSMLSQRLPVTLELVIGAFALALLIAIPCAVLAANHPHGLVDRLVSTVSILGLSLPGFVSGVLLILVFSVTLHLLPSEGFVPITTRLGTNLRSMVLPVVTMSFALFGIYAQMLRASMQQQLRSEEYVVTATAKGISRARLLVAHVLRNSLVPLVSVIGVNFGTVIGATVLLESVFGLPGIGQLLVNSISSKDVTAVEGIVLVLATIVILVNLLTDILYLFLDPRVRHGRN